MLGILVFAVFLLGFIMSIRILKVARKTINKRILYNVSGCTNYKTAMAIGILGFSLTGAFVWLSILNVLGHIAAGGQ